MRYTYPMVIKFIYTIFIALLIALFVGLGISTFYPGPKSPRYPSELEYETKSADCEETVEHKTLREGYDKAQLAFEEEYKVYNRNVSIISLVAAIVILVSSLTLLSKIKMISDGILLGGVFTTIYSIIRVLMSENSRFRFIIVAIGLIIALILGYIKFIREKENPEHQ